jgi:hypothetical protein
MPNPAATAHPLSLARFQGFISRTYKSKFVRNVAVVASGTAGAQAITMAFSPIITRLYGPEAFACWEPLWLLWLWSPPLPPCPTP